MTFRVPIDRLLLGKNPPAGMNPLLLMHLAYDLRATRKDPPPILVTSDLQYWRITDGRHRAISALIAGRPDVLATMEDR